MLSVVQGPCPDGKVYDIDPGDFDRAEWRAFRDVTGRVYPWLSRRW